MVILSKSKGTLRTFFESFTKELWAPLKNSMVKFEVISLAVLIICFALIMILDKKSFKKIKSLFNLVLCGLLIGVVLVVNIFLRTHFYLEVSLKKILLWKYMLFFLNAWVFIICGSYVGVIFAFISDVLCFYLAPNWKASGYRITYLSMRIFSLLFVYYMYVLIEKLVRLKNQKNTVIIRNFCFVPVLCIGILIECIGNTIYLGTYISLFTKWYFLIPRFTYQLFTTLIINNILFALLYYKCYYTHLSYFKNHFESIRDSIVKTEENMKKFNIKKTTNIKV